MDIFPFLLMLVLVVTLTFFLCAGIDLCVRVGQWLGMLFNLVQEAVGWQAAEPGSGFEVVDDYPSNTP